MADGEDAAARLEWQGATVALPCDGRREAADAAKAEVEAFAVHGHIVVEVVVAAAEGAHVAPTRERGAEPCIDKGAAHRAVVAEARAEAKVEPTREPPPWPAEASSVAPVKSQPSYLASDSIR